MVGVACQACLDLKGALVRKVMQDLQVLMELLGLKDFRVQEGPRGLMDSPENQETQDSQ